MWSYMFLLFQGNFGRAIKPGRIGRNGRQDGALWRKIRIWVWFPIHPSWSWTMFGKNFLLFSWWQNILIFIILSRMYTFVSVHMKLMLHGVCHWMFLTSCKQNIFHDCMRLATYSSATLYSHSGRSRVYPCKMTTIFSSRQITPSLMLVKKNLFDRLSSYPVGIRIFKIRLR